MTSPNKTCVVFASTSLSKGDEEVYVTDLVAIASLTAELHYLAATSDGRLVWLVVKPSSIEIRQEVQNPHGPAGISCVSTSLATGSVLSGGRDGTIKVWDEGSKLLKTFKTLNGEPVSTVQPSDDTSSSLIAVGTENTQEGAGDAAIYLFDLKHQSGAAPVQAFVDSHSDTITQLQLQPDGRNTCLISSSTDNSINVFDLSIKDEDDAVEVGINNEAPVNHFMMVPIPDGGLSHGVASILAVSTDERMNLHAAWPTEDKPGVASAGQADLRQLLNCDYIIGMTKDISKPLIFVGAYKPETTHEPRVDIFMAVQSPRVVDLPPHEAAGGISHKMQHIQWDLVARLPGGHGTEVVRKILLSGSPAEKGGLVAVTCGEDGTVKAWRELPGDAGVGASGGSEPQRHKKKNKSSTAKGGSASQRHTPY